MACLALSDVVWSRHFFGARCKSGLYELKPSIILGKRLFKLPYSKVQWMDGWYPGKTLSMSHPVVSRYFDTVKVRYRYRGVVPQYFDIDPI